MLQHRPRDESAFTFASAERRFAVEAGGGAQFFLDAQQLVVLGDAVGARSRAGLDLSRTGRNRQVGDKSVLGFAREVRNDGVVSGLARQLNRVICFAYAAVLVELD